MYFDVPLFFKHGYGMLSKNGMLNEKSLTSSAFLYSDIKGGAGPADALFINTIPKPKPKISDAVVKIKAFGLNRMDLLQRQGHYPVPPQAPRTLGVEFSGVVESLGPEPERDFKVGDEVFGLAYGGSLSFVSFLLSPLFYS